MISVLVFVVYVLRLLWKPSFRKVFNTVLKCFAFDRSEVRKRNILELVFVIRNAKVVLYFTSKQLIYDSLTSDITVGVLF